jgi:hypothetical protein
VSKQIAKSQVQRELPNLATLKEHGIGTDLETARLILAVASRVIVNGHANHREAIYRAMCGIGLAVSLDLVDEDGMVIPGLLDEPAGVIAPTGEKAAKTLGVRASAFNKAWSDGPEYVTSCLPLAVVLAFLPASSWPYLAAFIKLGPHDARNRLSQAASLRRKTMTPKALAASARRRSCSSTTSRVSRGAPSRTSRWSESSGSLTARQAIHGHAPGPAGLAETERSGKG